MVIGIPKEIKDGEFRVSLVPSGVRALKEAGHRVVVEAGAGAGSGIPDVEFEKAGAEVIGSAADVWKRADLIVKVKEPLPEEYRFLRDGLLLFTFLHLAANPDLANQLLRSGAIAVAYETVEDAGKLPILAPMSEIAGRISVQAGAYFLMRPYGGEGVLLGGVPGVPPGNVVILGAGNVGANAARVAVGLGAEVTVINTGVEKLKYLDDLFNGRIKTLASNSYNIEEAVSACDLLIGAVHRPGGKTPKLVSKGLVSRMKKGSVIVDVSVDQGGCVETIFPTTFSSPTYEIDGVLHYGVANMPGGVPRTSTFALTNATLPFVLKLAVLGLKDAAAKDPALSRGINIHRGRVTHPEVAVALGKEFTPLAF